MWHNVGGKNYQDAMMMMILIMISIMILVMILAMMNDELQTKCASQIVLFFDIFYVYQLSIGRGAPWAYPVCGIIQVPILGACFQRQRRSIQYHFIPEKACVWSESVGECESIVLC